MQPLKKERLFWWVTVPALVAVLATLGVLQYHWSTQISVATREQMQASLQRSLMLFREDLARELSAVAVELRSAAADPSNLRAADFSRQFRHWQTTAVHPGMVDQVYLWQPSPKDALLLLDTSHDQLVPAEWPAAFDKLHQHLLAAAPVIVNRGFVRRQRRAENGDAASNHNTHSDRSGAGHRDFASLGPWMIAQDIPALVHPLLQRTPDNQLPTVNGWIIVQLNAGVLEKEVFPELAQKYFVPRGSSGSFRVAVLGPKDSVLYSSGGWPNSHNVADLQVPLFGPPFFGPPIRRSDGSNGPPSMAFMANMRSGGGRPSSDDRRGPAMDRLVRLEPFPYSAEDGLWQVAVKHQTGSLDAAVNGLHRRNLMISFGV